MCSKEGGYEQEGRIKVEPPMFNSHSYSNACLGINWPPMDVSNDTKTTALQPPMSSTTVTPTQYQHQPLPPTPSPKNSLPSCIPHCQHGGSCLSDLFFSLISSSPTIMMITLNSHPRHILHSPLIIWPSSDPTPILNTGESDGDLCFPPWAPCDSW